MTLFTLARTIFWWNSIEGPPAAHFNCRLCSGTAFFYHYSLGTSTSQVKVYWYKLTQHFILNLVYSSSTPAACNANFILGFLHFLGGVIFHILVKSPSPRIGFSHHSSPPLLGCRYPLFILLPQVFGIPALSDKLLVEIFLCTSVGRDPITWWRRHLVCCWFVVSLV